jgi:hypothetical protein
MDRLYHNRNQMEGSHCRNDEKRGKSSPLKDFLLLRSMTFLGYVEGNMPRHVVPKLYDRWNYEGSSHSDSGSSVL